MCCIVDRHFIVYVYISSSVTVCIIATKTKSLAGIIDFDRVHGRIRSTYYRPYIETLFICRMTSDQMRPNTRRWDKYISHTTLIRYFFPLFVVNLPRLFQ